jgi:hypothetical protein
MKNLSFCFLIMVTLSFSQNYQYLGEYNANGKPLYLQSQNAIISDESEKLINNSLHKGLYIPEYYPNYFTSGYDSDISLSCETEVFITFINEYASYNNALGFYTYPSDAKPQYKPTNDQITIIFPNLNEDGDNSALVKGNRVSLGLFPENTSIGFILISNGWNGTNVGEGVWKLFTTKTYNDDLEEGKNHQNLLIKDEKNEAIILSFEDIKRNSISCDEDFNDAIFLVTTNSYNCVNTNNLIENCTSDQVSSAYYGGLESNGDLAHLIASRNINRLNNELVPPIGIIDELNCYFPPLGVDNEIAVNTSPYDLINYSNAIEVYGVDYEKYNLRNGAGLVMKTKEKVYNHKKSICDRLNGGKVIDIREVTIDNHKLILTIIETANDEKEYSVHFSVRTKATVYEVLSYWDVEDYPCVDFLNFQIWGKDMTQVSHITNYVFDKFELYKKVVSSDNNKIPEVFASAANYRNKKIFFDIVNKNKSTYIDLSLTYRTTELSEAQTYNQRLLLNGEFNQNVILNTDYIYDVNISLIGEKSNNIDKLYISDGPWGFITNDNNIINNYVVNEQESIINEDNSETERNFSVNGLNTDRVMFFKNILSGDKSINISGYESISFNITNNKPIELILVYDNLDNWSNKLSYFIENSYQNETLNIPLNEFSTINQSSKSVSRNTSSSNLKSVVFSINSNNQISESFNLSIDKLGFKSNTLGNQNDYSQIIKNKKALNYPNPFHNKTTFIIPTKSSNTYIEVFDLQGKKIYKSKITMNDDLLTFDFYKGNLIKGIYLYKINDFTNNNSYLGKIIID